MPQADNRKSPEVFVFFGMIATGKSTIAQAWSWKEQLRCYNSDWVRKELAGVDPSSTHHESMERGIYTKEFSTKTYTTLLERAADRLRQGDSVVLDASYQYARDRQDIRNLASRLGCRVYFILCQCYQYARDRQDIRNLASRLGCRVYFILCQCAEAEMKHRMDLRSLDPAAVSDGRWEVYLQQKKRFEPPEELPDTELIILNTAGSAEDILADLQEKMTEKREKN